MKYEYGEPLEQSRRESNDIDRADGEYFARIGVESNRHRIIACINACAGVSNEDLEIMGLGGVPQIMTQRKLDERNLRSEAEGKEPNGPPLTADQATNWEWTGEQPRKLRRGESGLCEPRHDSERPWIMRGCPTSESTSSYWPLRRRQTPKPDGSPNPQNATLDDIADLLQRILDRMPERGVE